MHGAVRLTAVLAAAILLAGASALAWWGTPAQVSAAADLAVALTAIATASFLIWDRLNARPAKLSAWGYCSYEPTTNLLTVQIEVESETPEPLSIFAIRAPGYWIANPGDGTYVQTHLDWRSEHSANVALRRGAPHHRFTLLMKGEYLSGSVAAAYQFGQPSAKLTPNGASAGGSRPGGHRPASALKSSVGRVLSSLAARRKRSSSLTIQIVFARASDLSRRITKTIRI